MIVIRKSETADTRTCDFAHVSKETLLASSRQHIGDVQAALTFFTQTIATAMHAHDTDKITDIDGFHEDFLTGFKKTDWWDRHRKLNRHHLTMADGVPADVNLIDVLDFIADCVMAGMARSGSVYDLQLRPELLEAAFQNTVALLKAQVTVTPEPSDRGDPQAARVRHDGQRRDRAEGDLVAMAKFRKKPVVIEAQQYRNADSWPDGVFREPDGSAAYIDTLEGRLHVSEGDWIITGVKGERYPCKPDIFAATYEPAEETVF